MITETKKTTLKENTSLLPVSFFLVISLILAFIGFQVYYLAMTLLAE